MKLVLLTPKDALGKAELAFKPTRAQIDRFKSEMSTVIGHINPAESEEYHKSLISDFLKKTYFAPSFFINTKGKADLVIHTGADASHSVGVLVEVKRPTNSQEMLRPDHINAKAFQELVLYYMRERFDPHQRNLNIKNLVVTNGWEWFIFSADLFEREFAQSTNFVKLFKDFEASRLAGKTTDFFYKEIASPAISAIKSEVRFAYFDVRDYEPNLKPDDRSGDRKIALLYRLLSPSSLLRLPVANDSNTLDRAFYTELLHVIGLSETKDGSKRLISRKDAKNRDPGSLIENAIVQIESLDKLERVKDVSSFGSNRQERLFNIALQLSLTWVNRVLFLKLLEAQLTTFAGGASEKKFLGADQVSTFEDLMHHQHRRQTTACDTTPHKVGNKGMVLMDTPSTAFEAGKPKCYIDCQVS